MPGGAPLTDDASLPVHPPGVEGPAAGSPDTVVAEPRTTWWRVLAAVSLLLVTVAALVIGAKIAARSDPNAPLALPGVEAPAAESAPCTTLLSALHGTIGDQPPRTLDPPVPGAAAWGNPPIVLRCGIPTPAELSCSSALQVVDGVAWLQLSGSGQTTYLVADRPVRIALTVPDGSGTAAIQDVSAIVAGTTQQQSVCSEGALTPVEGD